MGPMDTLQSTFIPQKMTKKCSNMRLLLIAVASLITMGPQQHICQITKCKQLVYQYLLMKFDSFAFRGTMGHDTLPAKKPQKAGIAVLVS